MRGPSFDRLRTGRSALGQSNLTRGGIRRRARRQDGNPLSDRAHPSRLCPRQRHL